MNYKLSDIAFYAKDRVEVSSLDIASYISTENMLPEKAGITVSSGLPKINSTQGFQPGDVLVSNIRPYFKKIWKATFAGGCSNDVLVFRPSYGINSDFLYLVLCNDSFFDYMVASSKGTKMPRGDKASIMNYAISEVSLKAQMRIVGILKPLIDKIAINEKINDNLLNQAQKIFKAISQDTALKWRNFMIGEVSEISAGGDKPDSISEMQSDKYPFPIYSNGIDNEGLYGFTDKAKIFSESVTVSARGTIGYVCLRHIPYVPIVRLISLVPNPAILSAKYLYLFLKQLHISGTGTTQQQLTIPDFRKTRIMIPDKKTMDRFTNCVTPLFNKIWTNEEENSKLSALRDALLPKLIAGDIEISDL